MFVLSLRTCWAFVCIVTVLSAFVAFYVVFVVFFGSRTNVVGSTRLAVISIVRRFLATFWRVRLWKYRRLWLLFELLNQLLEDIGQLVVAVVVVVVILRWRLWTDDHLAWFVEQTCSIFWSSLEFLDAEVELTWGTSPLSVLLMIGSSAAIDSTDVSQVFVWLIRPNIVYWGSGTILSRMVRYLLSVWLKLDSNTFHEGCTALYYCCSTSLRGWVTNFDRLRRRLLYQGWCGQKRSNAFVCWCRLVERDNARSYLHLSHFGYGARSVHRVD